MMAQYQYCDFAGSYWVDCSIVEKRKCSVVDASDFDKLIGRLPKRLGCDGYVIRHEYDGETVTKWVPAEYVKLPEISDWVGL